MLLIYLGILICIFILNRILYIFFLHSYLPVLKYFAAFTQPPISPVQNQISSLELLLCHKAGNITHPNSKSGSRRVQVLARLSLLHLTRSHTQFSRETFSPASFCYSAVPGFKLRDWLRSRPLMDHCEPWASSRRQIPACSCLFSYQTSVGPHFRFTYLLYFCFIFQPQRYLSCFFSITLISYLSALVFRTKEGGRGCLCADRVEMKV